MKTSIGERYWPNIICQILAQIVVVPTLVEILENSPECPETGI